MAKLENCKFFASREKLSVLIKFGDIEQFPWNYCGFPVLIKVELSYFVVFFE